MKSVLFLVAACIVLAGCKKEEDSPVAPTASTTVTVKEADLYAAAKTTAGFVYYKNSTAYLSKSAGSAHAEPLLRTRYNAKAATMLDANGKVKSGAVFSDSSLIIKELTNADRTINLYAVMFKLSKAANADANGWVWAEFNTNGNVAYATSNKGAGCIGCHGTGIDHTRMNDQHP